MTDWQPIETAPDDEIMLVCGQCLAPTTAIKVTSGYYAGQFFATCDEVYPIYESGDSEEKIVFGSYLPLPTHWTPLPASPIFGGGNAD